jgi:hypothetical protein
VKSKPSLVTGIDQLVGGWRDVSEDPRPAIRVHALPHPQHAPRDRRAANSVKAVAARHDLAPKLVLAPVVDVPDDRRIGLEPLDPDVLAFEIELLVQSHPRRDQILHDLRLTIDRRRATRS